MPRVYKSAPESRTYKNYDEDTLQKAILEITKGRLSLRKAADDFKIPIGTLSHRINGKHDKPVGGPTALNCQEEKTLAECLITCADGGFPLSPNEIKSFTKYYLQSIGKHCRQFKDGCTPGDDWVRLFLLRHKDELTEKIATPRRGRLKIIDVSTETHVTSSQENVLNNCLLDTSTAHPSTPKPSTARSPMFRKPPTTRSSTSCKMPTTRSSMSRKSQTTCSSTSPKPSNAHSSTAGKPSIARSSTFCQPSTTRSSTSRMPPTIRSSTARQLSTTLSSTSPKPNNARSSTVDKPSIVRPSTTHPSLSRKPSTRSSTSENTDIENRSSLYRARKTTKCANVSKNRSTKTTRKNTTNTSFMPGM